MNQHDSDPWGPQTACLRGSWSPPAPPGRLGEWYMPWIIAREDPCSPPDEPSGDGPPSGATRWGCSGVPTLR